MLKFPFKRASLNRCSFLFVITIGISQCNDRSEGYHFNGQSYDISTRSGLINNNISCEQSGRVPTVIIKENDQVDVTCASIATASIIQNEYKFNVNLVDYSEDNLMDRIVFSGYQDDSILTFSNPLSVTYKKKIYLKSNNKLLLASIQEGQNKVTVLEDNFNTSSRGYDIDLTFPDLPICNLITNEEYHLTFALEADYDEILILTTSASCKPCFHSFQRYAKSKSNKKMLIILLFPKNTSKKEIFKYANHIKPNILLCSGDINVIRHSFGLYSLPEGVLFDSNGQVKRLHVTLDSFL